MKNLEIICYLKSPLCGDPPCLDSLMGNILGIEQGSLIDRETDLSTCVELDIPLEKEFYNEFDWFYKCSNPLFNVEFEWLEYWSKRLELEKIAAHCQKNIKSISTGSGKYKSYRSSILCRHVDFVKWFCVGDKEKIKDVLNKISAIGIKRSIGYGFIKTWEIKEVEHDFSIFYEIEGKKYLLKNIPHEFYKANINWGLQNFRLEYGAYKPPYWHSKNFVKLIVPC